MKHSGSIARKVTARLSVLVLIVLCAMFFSCYRGTSAVVRDDAIRYGKTLVSVYADLLVFEADSSELSMGEFSENIPLFGDYLCLWYRSDYAYVYRLEEGGRAGQLLGFSYNDDRINAQNVWQRQERVSAHMDAAELAELWRGERSFIVSESREFERAMEIVTAATDLKGNRVAVGIGLSLDEVDKSIRAQFLNIASVLLVLFIGLIAATYAVFRKNIIRPARRLSSVMTAFISNGRRSRERLSEDGSDEYAMIARAFNHMTDEIDAYLESIRALNLSQEKQQSEYDLAANIQQGFLPPETYSSDKYEISAMMTPAKDVGGDLYDYLPLDDERMLIAVADVSGKGLAASMYMSIMLMLVRQYARMGQNPAEILKSVNDAIADRNPRMQFATAFVGIYNSRERTLIYANAGHNPPYLLSGRCRALDGARNALIGIYPGEVYAETRVRLKPGDILFLYTDGVSEAANEQREFFGCERLERVLEDFRANHSEDLTRCVRDAMARFTGTAEQSDDITMLSLTVKNTYEIDLYPDAREFARVRDAIMSGELPRQTQLDLCVAAEECFMNICAYAYPDGVPEGEKIGFRMERCDRITLRFTDGGIPYDPTKHIAAAEEYDMDTQIGGLGKLIAFTVADKVEYEYANSRNVLTITKYMEDSEYDHQADD